MTFAIFYVLVLESNKTVYLSMYLEERVEQLEHLSVDQGRQIETIARGLADLTVTVNQRFDEVNQRFEEVNQRFEEVNQRFEEVNQRFDAVDKRFDKVEADVAELKTDVSELKSGQARLETTVADIQQTQHLILTILQDKLK